MRAKVHTLKCHPEPFEAMRSGVKMHEVRKTDRDYEVGDILYLREWIEPVGNIPGLVSIYGGHTGREIRRRITYISRPSTWGLPNEVCVLSLTDDTPDVSERKAYRRALASWIAVAARLGIDCGLYATWARRVLGDDARSAAVLTDEALGPSLHAVNPLDAGR